MNISINIKSLLILTFVFILFTTIGTVSHEYGHIIVAKALGYETTLHYGSMNYDSGIEKLKSNGLLVTIGGPFQTILTGTIGLLILLWRRKLIYQNGLKVLDWLAVFLSLFWLREVFNLVMSLSGEVISPNGTWFSGDELYISQGLNLWSGTVSIILGTIGMTVTIYVIFKIIPKKIRPTFIISGLIGGIVGFILWMNIIGPKILP